jgi:RNA polymerase sigma-70 factor (ECF subfamily)
MGSWAGGGSRRVPYGRATVSGLQWFCDLMEDDARLAATLADDLDRTFESVVLAHQDRLFTIALRMLGDRGEAEEAAQDAFVRAYRALATYDAARIRELRLRGWLTTIVLNLCRSRTSRRAARGVAPLSLDMGDGLGGHLAVPHEGSPTEVTERHAERDRWASRLMALPPAYRSAVVLRHVDGLSYPEAAAALGRPEGTVKAQVHRGIAQLRTMLEADLRPEPEEMTA